MNEETIFRLGTRGSPLALWQAERVKVLLGKTRPDAEIQIEIIHTTGDKILDKPLVEIGDKGLFTKEIEKALLEGTIDFAVHSLKDLPSQLPEGLAIVSIPERESPYDALVSRGAASLRELPANPTVATGSLRRKAQILFLRPDATVVDLRGNVNTRMRKFEESAWDAMIMAEAGLRRMGWTDRIAGVLSMEEMLPAPAQGALAVEARRDDSRTSVLVQSIHDAATAVGVAAERAFLARLEGGCRTPIAAHAQVEDEMILLEGLLSSLDGSLCIRENGRYSLENPNFAGKSLAERLLKQGGEEILQSLLA